MQQVPREERFRKIFKSRKGYRMVVADSSTLEPRVAAKLARDSVMRDKLMNSDFYSDTAQAIDGKPPTAQRRQQFKNFVMAYLFGAGPRRLAEQTGMDVEEALGVSRSFDDLYPAFFSWRLRMQRSSGYSVDGYPLDAGEESYKHIAWAVQSHAAYIQKRALIKLRKKYPKFHYYLVASVHDEIVLHVPKEMAKEAATALEKCMRVDDWITMPATAQIAKSWGEAK